MAGIALAVALLAILCATTSTLFRYGNVYRQRLPIIFCVLVAWFFSFIIIGILPMDVSSTMYRQCVAERQKLLNMSDLALPPRENEGGINPPSVVLPISCNGTEGANCTETPEPLVWGRINGFICSDLSADVDDICEKPWSLLPEYVLPELWRIVYWTSQCLTWIVLPMMQSYTKAGDFTVWGKLKTSLKDNAIWYSSYLLIVILLFVYIAVRPDLELDFSKLKIVAATASNTWGLFLLVLLLGYGLVEVPHTVWQSTLRGHQLNQAYFKAVKLALEKQQAQEDVDDSLGVIQNLEEQISRTHPFRPQMEVILSKLPTEMLAQLLKKRATMAECLPEAPSEKTLIRTHRDLMKNLQHLHRTETQWSVLVDRIGEFEDDLRNENSLDKRFRSSNPSTSSNQLWFRQYFFTPTVEWYWRCCIRWYVLRALFVVIATWSFFVVWSEVTFFNRSPVLSLFAVFIQAAKQNYDYLSIEVISFLTILYLCFCAYYALFKVRILNLYYLASNHQTDEYSLIFCGMMLCRLTPPLCLNFLGLVHLDSHVTSEKDLQETAYTQIMGHMDVISIISDGFNIYFPMSILALCLATWFSVGAKVLNMLGFQQFMTDDAMTTDMVEEGMELVRRERRRRARTSDTTSRRSPTHRRGLEGLTPEGRTGGDMSPPLNLRAVSPDPVERLETESGRIEDVPPSRRLLRDPDFGSQIRSYNASNRDSHAKDHVTSSPAWTSWLPRPLASFVDSRTSLFGERSPSSGRGRDSTLFPSTTPSERRNIFDDV
ncbi:unnamed protein product [Cyprideis torosa]|uniref:Uncharacterized protein n=1 Tax=Cyprideis torosa TaxID=163714 RepID=A0A7R8W8C2_9CRUS|nr:unnamed protein product [Cyprideis torosa]CAG0886083.1 unnamed protein product [Cyprideis torosa]